MGVRFSPLSLKKWNGIITKIKVQVIWGINIDDGVKHFLFVEGPKFNFLKWASDPARIEAFKSLGMTAECEEKEIET